MAPPEVKNWISAGNILQMAAMLVAVALAWGNLSSRTDASATMAADHEHRLRELEGEVASTLSRIDQRLITIEKAVIDGKGGLR